MDLSVKCSKYQLDDWGLCHYQINCGKDTCVNNCAINQDKIIMKG